MSFWSHTWVSGTHICGLSFITLPSIGTIEAEQLKTQKSPHIKDAGFPNSGLTLDPTTAAPTVWLSHSIYQILKLCIFDF